MRALFILLLSFALATIASAQGGATPSSYRISLTVVSGKNMIQLNVRGPNGITKEVLGLPAPGQTANYSRSSDFFAVEGAMVGGQFEANGRYFNAVPVYSGQPLPGLTDPDGNASGGNWNNNKGQPVDPETGKPKPDPKDDPSPIIPGGGGIAPGSGTGGTGGGGTGTGTGGGGSGNPPAQSYSAMLHITNPNPYPCAFRITIRDMIQGIVIRSFDTLTMQPGTSMQIKVVESFPFQWSREEIVDGQALGFPVFGDGTLDGTATNPGVGGTVPITPNLQMPGLSGLTDVKGAVDRHAEVTRMFGEAQRTAANIGNNNLESIKGLLGKATDKLGTIASNTAGLGSGGSGGGGSTNVTVNTTALETIEAGSQDILESINNKLGSATEIFIPPTVDKPADLTTPTDYSDEMEQVRAQLGTLASSLSTTASSLGLTARYSFSQLAWAAQTPLGTIYINLETFGGWLFDLIRAVMLGLLSIRFVSRLIACIRGALVDATQI